MVPLSARAVWIFMVYFTPLHLCGFALNTPSSKNRRKTFFNAIRKSINKCRLFLWFWLWFVHTNTPICSSLLLTLRGYCMFFSPFHSSLSWGETLWIQTEYFTHYWIISHAHLWGICIFPSVVSRVSLFYIWSSMSGWTWERGDVFARGIEKKKKKYQRRERPRSKPGEEQHHISKIELGRFSLSLSRPLLSLLHPHPRIIGPKENKLNPVLNYRLRPGSGDGLAAGGCRVLHTSAAAAASSVASPRCLIKTNIKHFSTVRMTGFKRDCMNM